jgi:hypothetical protein
MKPRNKSAKCRLQGGIVTTLLSAPPASVYPHLVKKAQPQEPLALSYCTTAASSNPLRQHRRSDQPFLCRRPLLGLSPHNLFACADFRYRSSLVHAPKKALHKKIRHTMDTHQSYPTWFQSDVSEEVIPPLSGLCRLVYQLIFPTFHREDARPIGMFRTPPSMGRPCLRGPVAHGYRAFPRCTPSRLLVRCIWIGELDKISPGFRWPSIPTPCLTLSTIRLAVGNCTCSPPIISYDDIPLWFCPLTNIAH